MLAVGLLLIAMLIPFAAACGGDDGGAEDDEAAAIQAFVDELVAAHNGGDVDAFLALVTDNWLSEEAQVTREEAPEALAQFLGDVPIAVDDVHDVSVANDSATATVSGTEGALRFETNFNLLLEGEAWVLDSEEDVPVAIPDGVTAIPLGLNEFAFDYGADAITTGDVAFQVTNSGEQDHEVVIFSADPGADVLEALDEAEQNQQEPQGVEFLAFSVPFAPGDTNTMVFAESLAPGRYVLVCFLPDTADAEQAPHAVKGMLSEFTVE